MKNQRLLKIFGEIDETYIEEAAPVFQKRTGQIVRMKWAAVAACAAIATFAGIYLVSLNTNEAPPDSTIEPPVIADNLPILASRFESGDMGFEGVMYYDISEADNQNPWTEDTQLFTLPVYRNLAYTDGAGAAVYLNDEDMLALAENTAAALGTTVEGTKYSRPNDTKESAGNSVSTEKAYQLTATTGLGDIRVSGNGEIYIDFEEPILLPEKYSFTFAGTSDKDAIKALQYLTEQYAGLHNFNDPVMESNAGDYTFSGEQYRDYRVYEGSGGIEEQILHYYFDSISFSPTFLPDGASNLSSIRITSTLNNAEKLGDYPLITAETAQKLLLANEYITSVPDEYLKDGIVKEEHIAKVELVYRTSNVNEIFMPYYRFYVELTEFDVDMAEGLKCYGAFYVPAVSGEYLSDFPIWDGSF